MYESLGLEAKKRKKTREGVRSKVMSMFTFNQLFSLCTTSSTNLEYCHGNHCRIVSTLGPSRIPNSRPDSLVRL